MVVHFVCQCRIDLAANNSYLRLQTFIIDALNGHDNRGTATYYKYNGQLYRIFRFLAIFGFHCFHKIQEPENLTR